MARIKISDRCSSTRFNDALRICATLLLLTVGSGAQSASDAGKSTDQTDEIFFFEDFETGAPGWQTVDLSATPTLWHTDDFNAYNGGISWWCGDSTIVPQGGYGDSILQFLESPMIDLTETSNPVLTFNLFYATQLDTDASSPYDGWDGGNVWISTNGGLTWQVLPIDAPIYNDSSLYSFGQYWNMGTNVPGWSGYSGGNSPGFWINASTLLTGYTQDSIKIRFVFCSDGVESTTTDSTWTGMFVDNVAIRQGATFLLRNNAQGVAYPSDLVPAIASGGSLWHNAEVLSPEPPSPTQVMWMSNPQGTYPPFTNCALITPDQDLTGFSPDSTIIFADFYLAGSLNVGDTAVVNADTWWIELSSDNGITWQGRRDYTILPSNFQLLSQFDSINPDGYSLNSYIGQFVQLRLVFQANPNVFLGSGMMVDNFQINATYGLIHDVAAENLYIPMPTSAYFDTLRCSMVLHNRGLYIENLIPAMYRLNGAPNSLIYQNPLAPGQTALQEFTWGVPDSGSYFFDSFTTLGSDLNRTNDTCRAGLVEITPDTVLEFGYDNRQYSYEATLDTFAFDPGTGPLIRYTPQTDGADTVLYGRFLKALFHNTGTIRVHLYAAGTDTTPGPELSGSPFDAAVSSIWPDWQTFDLSGIPDLQGSTMDFWVWYETVNYGEAQILGWHEISHGLGHFYDYGSGVITPATRDYFARAVMYIPIPSAVRGSLCAPIIEELTLYQNHPNPFNTSTSIRFVLKQPSLISLAVYDLLGREVHQLTQGDYSAGGHAITFEPKGLVSGIYLYRLETARQSLQKKMVYLK